MSGEEHEITQYANAIQASLQGDPKAQQYLEELVHLAPSEQEVGVVIVNIVRCDDDDDDDDDDDGSGGGGGGGGDGDDDRIFVVVLLLLLLLLLLCMATGWAIALLLLWCLACHPPSHTLFTSTHCLLPGVLAEKVSSRRRRRRSSSSSSSSIPRHTSLTILDGNDRSIRLHGASLATTNDALRGQLLEGAWQVRILRCLLVLLPLLLLLLLLLLVLPLLQLPLLPPLLLLLCL